MFFFHIATVQLVVQTVQEYFNSADSYTICDSKGLAIADTSETKGNLLLLEIASQMSQNSLLPP